MSAADTPTPAPATNRRRLMIELAVLVVLSAVTAKVMWRPWHAPTQQDCNRVHNGMTRAEVEDILGPPGDYRSWATRVEFTPLDPQPASRRMDQWATDEGEMRVVFVDGRVVVSEFRNAWADKGVLDALKWRFKWAMDGTPHRW